ncbi:MAG: DUF599 domain-containing protein [Betaproteobacteria bacterium]|nr:DUF599 domain-containing protein [Betaproteobacteria bacterium]
MDFYRREWMGRTVQRENRIVDAAIVQNLFQGNNFLASTSILVLGGLAALLGASTQAIVVMASLPLAQASSERGFEIKIMLMIVIFIYAFFKFTWAMRQFNFLSLMIGTAPAKTITRPSSIHSSIALPPSLRLPAKIPIAACARFTLRWERCRGSCMRRYSWRRARWWWVFCTTVNFARALCSR